jgi:hypothetical protein
MQFVVEWKSLQPKESIEFFLSKAHTPPTGVKLINSLHTLGKPEGFVFLEGEAEALQAMVLALPPAMFETKITPVLGDELATKAFGARHEHLKNKK